MLCLLVAEHSQAIKDQCPGIYDKTRGHLAHRASFAYQPCLGLQPLSPALFMESIRLANQPILAFGLRLVFPNYFPLYIHKDTNS